MVTLYCNQCLSEVDGYEVESDDPEVGWCTRWCWETDHGDVWLEIRDTDWKE